MVSDSETAFHRFDNFFLVICFSLLTIFFLGVCLFVLMYPIDCLCGVIMRSYLSSLVKRLCTIIVCLFPKLSLDIRFRMINAIFGLVISNVLNC